MNKIIIAVILAVIVIGGGVFVLNKNNASMQMQNKPSQTPAQTGTTPTQSGSTQQMQMQASPTTITPIQTTSGQNAVTIQNYAFSPATLTVKAGDKVTWTNQDSVGHSATADDNSFDTGVLQNGQSGSIAFSKPGTYTYHCSVHPMMKGTIVVQ